MAIEIVLPDSGRVEFSDTLRPSARALNAVGDSVAAEIFWTSLDTTLVVVDSTTGTTFAKALGTGRLQARVGNLFSNPQTVSILAKLDSLRAASATRDTVFVTPVPPDTGADSLSDSLTVQAFAHPIAPVNRRVVYVATTYPASDSTITLLPNDSVLTTSVGVAAARVKWRKGPVPDSVVVTATMKRLDGTAVPDSVTFVVEFRP
ncbi:MAG TPA: hypothetical protein VGQ48_06775 [Gemmatimonadales bacterium]|nr:hypothetical protein [Gemmatimonadales bacterium]